MHDKNMTPTEASPNKFMNAHVHGTSRKITKDIITTEVRIMVTYGEEMVIIGKGQGQGEASIL